MTTKTLEAKRSHITVDTQRERNVANHDVDRAPAEMPARAIPPGRRSEARMDYRCLCSYEVLEAIDEESLVIKQGKGFVLNRSPEGILFFMALAPHAKQLIKVHTIRSKWRRTVHVFEVRWIRPVPVESHGYLYLAGCRRIFGPRHCPSF